MIYAWDVKAKLDFVTASGKVQKIKKGILVDKEEKRYQVYSAGNPVSYQIDTERVYIEDVEEGADVLHPSYIPAKEGYIFVGWREDAQASEDVLTSKTMDTETLTLYAVFRSEEEYVLTLYNGSSEPVQTNHYRYYNNSNVRNPTVTLTQADLSGWSPIGWTEEALGSDVSIENGEEITLSGDVIYYGVYSKIVTLSYAANGGTGSMESSTGTAYRHSYSGVTNANITLSVSRFTRTNYEFQKWALNSTDGTQYAAGDALSLSDNAVMYALWELTQILLDMRQLAKKSSTNGGYGGYTSSTGFYIYIVSGNDEKAGVYYYNSFSMQGMNKVSVDWKVTESGGPYARIRLRINNNWNSNAEYAWYPVTGDGGTFTWPTNVSGNPIIGISVDEVPANSGHLRVQFSNLRIHK